VTHDEAHTARREITLPAANWYGPYATVELETATRIT